MTAVASAKAELARYTSAVTTYPAVSPLPGLSALKGKDVWFVPIGRTPSLDAMGTAIEHALAEVGMHAHVSPGAFLPTTVASCLAQARRHGADAVVTGYVDYDLAADAIDLLVAQDIPVLLAGATPIGNDGPSPRLACYDTTPTLQLAQKLQLDAVIAHSNATANVLYIGISDSRQLADAAAYARAYLADHGPDCSMTAIHYRSAEVDELPSRVTAALRSHPDTTHVVCEVDASAPRVIEGIHAAGRVNQVKLSGAEGDLDALQRIQSGSLQFVDAGFSAIHLGWQFADGILRMLTGDIPRPTPTVVRLFTRDNVPSLSLTQQAYASMDWYGPGNLDHTFLTAWRTL